ncbi:hypothetical protein V6N13_094046 [Hibiscus sabdariffa]
MPTTNSPLDPPLSQTSSHTMPTMPFPSHSTPTIPSASSKGTRARGRPRGKRARGTTTRGRPTCSRIMEGYGIYSNLSNGMQILNPCRPSQRMLRTPNRNTATVSHPSESSETATVPKPQ